ncbi:MAG: hypothetical protein GTN78_20995 [Gemmatimonadales bacterium]|nr:hypothetical protein [Gemmatimonadales bacterium]NIN12969.1 hypothetical protein [Gemmatimonadales bacterium]NIR02644.1 hypothetical protein [Gemmatimonadales bacterium]NIS67220.1 hypothetical protein [Gemmatimonadales bacterium]
MTNRAVARIILDSFWTGYPLTQGLFGSTGLGRAVYLAVGLSAIYQGVQWKAIQRRWGVVPVRASRS